MSAPQLTWSALGSSGERLPMRWPHPATREWAWGGSSGRGVRVCIVDSGIEPAHPLVGPVDSSHVAVAGEDGEVSVVTDEEGDVSGHGTACGGIVRAIAPECELHGVRVLGPDLTGTGKALLAGLEWAVRQGFDVINTSLSTRKRAFADVLRELADDAYFERSLLVCSAHNATVESFRGASPRSFCGSHDRAGLLDFDYNARGPVEFFGAGSTSRWRGRGRDHGRLGQLFVNAAVAGIARGSARSCW